MDDERVELQDGQRVSFSEVRGMTELNDSVYVIKDVKAHSFKLANCDSSSFGAYVGGGIATQVKETKRLEFKTLADATRDPGEFLLSDFAKFDRGPVLHLGFQALERFAAARNGALPVPGDAGDAEALVALAREINDAAPDGAAARGRGPGVPRRWQPLGTRRRCARCSAA